MRYQIGDEPVPGYKYKLEGFLGEGSYGEVWKAAGPGGVPCALKFIRIDSKSGLKELKAIGLVKQLRHPNLVPVQAIWLKDPEGNLIGDTQNESVRFQLRANKELIIAMGLGEKSLTDRLAECRAKKGTPDTLPGGVPLRELLRCMDDAARGIDYLNEPIHDFGGGPAAIVHCDIKPGNLLIVGGGVQVCDYGVARALAQDAASQAKKTLAAGTPAYAPAELINNEPCATTDQYSLAVTYYELRTGRLPFEESRALVCNLTGALDLSLLPPGERDVIRQATAIRPEDRFPNCTEMIEALRAAAAVTRSAKSAAVPNPPPRVSSGVVPMSQAPAAQPAPRAGQPVVGPKAGDLIVPVLRLERPIGNNRTGKLWEARGPGGERFAVKIVRGVANVTLDLSVLDRARGLSHPNLVPFRRWWLLAGDGSEIPADRAVRGSGPMPAAVVVAADYVERTLQNRLNECLQRGSQGIPKEELIPYVRQAAAALDYLNLSNNVQHRDVGPDTLMLRGDQVQLSSFGLARVTDGPGGESRADVPGQWTDYSAPEVLANRVSARTDEYSLAVTYYTLRTGLLPFPPARDTATAIRARNDGRYDLSAVTPAEEAVLVRALSPNPADRFGSCEEFVRQLALAVGTGSTEIHAPLAAVENAAGATSTRPRSDPSLRLGSEPPVMPSGYTDLRTARPADTPRSTPSEADGGDVPLTPAAAEYARPAMPSYGGTISFSGPAPGALTTPPRYPEPDVATPVSWKDTATEPRKSTRRLAQTDVLDDEPPRKSKAGALAAVAVGLAMVVVVVGGGVYLVVRGGGGPTTVASGPTTEPTGASQQGEQNEPPKRDRELATAIRAHLVRLELDDAGAKVAELRGHNAPLAAEWEQRLGAVWEIRGLIDANNAEAARARLPRLTELDPQIAEAVAVRIPRSATTALPPANDALAQERAKRLDAAREDFRARRLDAALAALASVQGVSSDPTDAAEWKLLRGAWERAKAADTAAVADFQSLKDYQQAYSRLADVPALATVDQSDLAAFAKVTLARKVEAAIPPLDEATDWEAMARWCAAAAPTPPVTACLNECWAELSRGGKTPTVDGKPFDPPPAADLGDTNGPLAGYDIYVKARRKGATPEAASLAVAVIPAGDPNPPAWLSALRAECLADLLFEASTKTRNDKEFDQPYPADAKDVPAWLAAADRAAQAAAFRLSKDRLAAIRLERLLAAWSVNKSDASLGKVADVLKAAKVSDALDAPAAVRFWAIYAATRGSSEADRTAAAHAYREAIRLASSRGANVPLPFVSSHVLAKLADSKFAEPFASADTATKANVADALTAAARYIRRHAAGLERADLPEKPAVVAARMFDTAFDLARTADAAAWRGIARAEGPSPSVEQLEQDLRAATEGGTTSPAAVTLGGLVERVKAGRAADVTDQLDHYEAAETALGLAITAGEGDRDRWADELAVAYEAAARNAIQLANLAKATDTQARFLDTAVARADALARLAPGRPEVHELRGCALEDRAWLLKPPTRFDPGVESEYAKADAAFAAAGNRPAALMHRGRNQFKEAEDRFYSQLVAVPDKDQLATAEKLLRDAVQGAAGGSPAVEAEARYWLGRVDVLRYFGTPDISPTKAKLYAQAVGHYAAAGRTADPEAQVWGEATGQALQIVHALEGERLARAKKFVDARTVADALVALAGGTPKLPLSAPLAAKARAEAVRIRQKADDEGKDWYADLKAAVEPGLGAARSQDVGIQLELRVILAEATASPRKWGVGDPSAAVKVLESGARAAEASKAVDPLTLADFLGTLGFLRYESGYYHDDDTDEIKKKATELRGKMWPLARPNLTSALDLAPAHPKAWKWKYALSIMYATSAVDDAGKPAAATAAARSFQLFREAEMTAYALHELPSADPDDRVIAHRVWVIERKKAYEVCKMFVDSGLEADEHHAAAPLWRLVQAEAACALSGKYGRKTEERAKLNKALTGVKKGRNDLPADLQKVAEQMVTRVETYLETRAGD